MIWAHIRFSKEVFGLFAVILAIGIASVMQADLSRAQELQEGDAAYNACLIRVLGAAKDDMTVGRSERPVREKLGR